MTITSGSWQSWVARSSKLQAESDGGRHFPPDTKSPAHRRVAVKGTGTPHGHMTSCTVPMATSDHSSSPEAPFRVVVLAPQPSGERHQTRFHDRVSFEHSQTVSCDVNHPYLHLPNRWVPVTVNIMFRLCPAWTRASEMAWIMESLRGEVSDKTVTTIGTCPGLEMLGRGGKGEERKQEGRGRRA